MEKALGERLDAIDKEQADQRWLLQLVLELQCPKCGPAALVRMHPELGPEPLRPLATVALPPENGHVHE